MANINNLHKNTPPQRRINENSTRHLMQAHEAHFGEQGEDFRLGFFANQAQFNIRNNHL
jgi:hypothetical protein